MPKQRDLIKKLQKAAKARGVSFEKDDRPGGNHDVHKLGGRTISIPPTQGN